MLFRRWPPGVSEALTDLCQSDLTLCPALLTVQPGGDPGARNLSSVEGEEPLLPRVVPMISVSAGSHASSGKCRSDFSLLPNLGESQPESGPSSWSPPLVLTGSAGNTGHSLGMWSWLEGGDEGEGLAATAQPCLYCSFQAPFPLAGC